MRGVAFNGSNGSGKEPEEIDLDTEEGRAQMPPFIGELSVAAQMKILEKVREWQAEGKLVNLEASVIILRLGGADIPGKTITMSGTAKGLVGEQIGEEEILTLLAETLHNNCEAMGYQDPILKGAALEKAAIDFVMEMKAFLEPLTESRWGRLRSLFPSRKREKKVLDIVKEFVAVGAHINQHGDLPTPDESESVDDLSRGDFEGK